MKNSIAFFFLAFLFGCNAETNTTENKELNSDTLALPKMEDSTQSEIQNFEAIYTKKLAAPCACDIFSSFDLYGEGETYPLNVIVDSTAKEFEVMAAHISGSDGLDFLYVDSLADGTKFTGNQAKIRAQGLSMSTWLNAGPVYAWPDDQSQVVFQLKSSSNWSWDKCYENWVRVSQYDSKAGKYKYGWAKKTSNEK